MNKNLKIGFNQQEYDIKVESLTSMAQIYIDASKELEKLRVKNIKADNLIKGGFIDFFTTYQMSEFNKSKFAKELEISFEKFLDLKQLDLSKLKELEQNHENLKNKTFELYDYNDSFFKYAELMKSTNKSLRKALEKAPKKTSYKLLELFSINNNKVRILLPKKPFEVYAFHNGQIQLMQYIKDFVSIGKTIELDYNDLWPLLKKYLIDKSGFGKTGQNGLSNDLSKIIFSYNKILTYKI